MTIFCVKALAKPLRFLYNECVRDSIGKSAGAPRSRSCRCKSGRGGLNTLARRHGGFPDTAKR